MHQKNYISFVNDHSGSMYSIAEAAIKDFNANIKAIKDAASRDMLDTVVSVCEIGNPDVKLSVTVSNPHVLREKTTWQAAGGTPLWTGTLRLIEMLQKLPDAQKEDVSFLVMLTTDGAATDNDTHYALRAAIKPLLATRRWTFVARVPSNIDYETERKFLDLGIPAGNIQRWETTAAGMAKSTAQTTQAMSNYFTARSAGLKSSSVFYADAAQVNVQALVDISNEVSLYVVPPQETGIEIRDFVLTKRMQYLKGAAFYQLTKTEARVQPTKLIIVRDRTNGKIYSGKDARKMIGLPDNQNARLHPGDHKNFDIFIQSTSVNRKLVGGTGVIYWEAIGVPFTEADLAYLKPKPAQPAVVQLPAVPVSTRPTPSPVAAKSRTTQRKFFATRTLARAHARAFGGTVKDNGPFAGKERWEVI